VETPRTDGTPCDAHCFEAATCQAGECAPATETEVQCPEPADPCIEAILCDMNSGLCDAFVLAVEETPCNDDDDVCSLEACDDKGKCVDAQETNICAEEASAYPCWNWVCNTLSGCLQTTWAVGNPCDDGDPCTTLDQCVVDEAGNQACDGDASAIDDGNECTVDFCDAEGVQNLPLDDGTECVAVDESPCSGLAACEGGVCVAPLTCGCASDDDCDVKSWCRPTEEGSTECVPYQAVDDPCGGLVVPWLLEKCLPVVLDCAYDPLDPPDLPGVCTVPEDPPVDPPVGIPCDDPGEGNLCVIAPVTQDTWLENASPKGTQVWMILGKHASYPIKRSLAQFDMDVVPENAAVLSATLKVYFVYAHKASGSTEAGVDRVIRAHQMLVPWNEATATSSNAQIGQPWTASLAGVDGTDAKAEAEDTSLFEWQVTQIWHDFDITALAKTWLAVPSSNYGVLLMAENETVEGRDMRLRSSNAPETDQHAMIEIVYSLP
jgi:hypothetical protein